MRRLRVASIVEGHGEVVALPILLERVWYEMIRGEFIDVLRPPIRQPRDRLAQNKEDALSRAVALAAAKLRATSNSTDPELILILIDADDDLPCVLGPRLLQIARQSRRDKNISCVIANVEYETWFVASANSLQGFLELGDELPPVDPETQQLGKGWIQKRFKNASYSEAVDQAKLTASMDILVCREKSPSFNKFCRDLEKASDLS